MDEPRGVGPEDLPAIYREEFLRAMEFSRVQHDPGEEWPAFVEAVWDALVPAFGLDAVVEDRTGR